MRVRNARDLGLLVKDARTQAGLTQQEVAERAKVQRTWLSRLEAGEANPTFDTLLRVLAAVGLDAELSPSASVPTEAHLVDTLLERLGASRPTDTGPATPYVQRMPAVGKTGDSAGDPARVDRRSTGDEATDARGGEDDDGIPDDVLARLLGSA